MILIQGLAVAAALQQVGYGWFSFYRARGESSVQAVESAALVGGFLLLAVPGLVVVGQRGLRGRPVATSVAMLVVRRHYVRRLFGDVGFACMGAARRAARAWPAQAPRWRCACSWTRARCPSWPCSVLVTFGAIWVADRPLLAELLRYLRRPSETRSIAPDASSTTPASAAERRPGSPVRGSSAAACGAGPVGCGVGARPCRRWLRRSRLGRRAAAGLPEPSSPEPVLLPAGARVASGPRSCGPNGSAYCSSPALWAQRRRPATASARPRGQRRAGDASCGMAGTECACQRVCIDSPRDAKAMRVAARPSACARPRLPRERAGRRPGLLGDLRSLPRCGHLHADLRRARAPRGGSRVATVHTSFLQRLRPTRRTFRALLPLYPAAIESFDLSGYDLVISSSSAWAHGVICDEDALHTSATATTRSATRGTSATARCGAPYPVTRAALGACSGAGGNGTGSPPSAWTAT